MEKTRHQTQSVWLLLLLLVLASNTILYRTGIGSRVLDGAATHGVVAGSLVDFAIVAPLLYLAWRKKFTWKSFLAGAAIGLIAARFIIPAESLGRFETLTWAGFAAEGALLLLEVCLLASLFVYLPSIIRSARSDRAPWLFSFPAAVDRHVRKHPLIQAICSEMLMVYYAFASWKKHPPTGERSFTLHRKTSYIAFHVMLIHAIVIETLGIHWWLHDRSLVLSVILLLLNIYSVVYFIAEIRAVVLTPVQFDGDSLYLSLGLSKRMSIRYGDIAAIELISRDSPPKTQDGTIEFIARDFETLPPHAVLRLARPCEAVLFMGIRKTYDQVRIRLDEPDRFVRKLERETGLRAAEPCPPR